VNDTLPLLPTNGGAIKKALFAAGVILWIAVVFGAYYAVHKPVPATLIQANNLWGLLQGGWEWAALRGPLLDLGFAAWLLVIAIGSGALLVERLLGAEQAGLQEQVIFGAALGMGALSILIFLLSVLRLLSPGTVGFVLGVFTAASVLGWRRMPYPERPFTAAGRAIIAGGAHIRLLKMCFALIALCLLTKALTPPTAWDSLVYHLTLPLRTIEAGGLPGNSDAAHFYFPSLVEQLFTIALMVRDDSAARLTHLLFAGIGAAAVFCFLRRYCPYRRDAAWVGLAILASATSLLSLATQAYVEWGLLTSGFLAFWALQEALQRSDRRWLILSGCCAGLAMAVKYNAVFIVVPLGALLLWQVFRTWRLTQNSAFPTWKDGAWWAFAAASVASPWYLKNLALTGNPFYPLVFGGWNWDAWKTAWITRPGSGLISEPIRVLSAPWELTVLGTEGAAFYDATVGPLFLGLLPMLVVLPRSEWARRAATVFGCAYLGWLIGAAQSELLVQGRLLLPALPFLAIILASALQGASRFSLPYLRLQFFVYAAVALVVGLTTVSVALSWASDPPLPFLLGAETREAFQERHLGDHYRAMSFINNQLPADAKVLFLWEPRSYLCERTCQPDTLLFNWRRLLYAHGASDAIRDALKSDGITHVLAYGGGFRYYSEPPHVEMEGPHIAALLEFEARYLERLSGPSLLELTVAPAERAAGGGYVVYRLK